MTFRKNNNKSLLSLMTPWVDFNLKKNFIVKKKQKQKPKKKLKTKLNIILKLNEFILNTKLLNTLHKIFFSIISNSKLHAKFNFGYSLNKNYLITLHKLILKNQLKKTLITTSKTLTNLTKVNIISVLSSKLHFVFRLLSLEKNSFLKKITLNNKSLRNKFLKNFDLNLNFKRNRFFPFLYMNFYKTTILNNSLGVVSNYFSLKKSFLKSKNSYMLSVVYLRRILLYIKINAYNLNIIRTPKFLKDILSSLLERSNIMYKHPFNSTYINESVINQNMYFSYVNFTKSKSITVIKRKKKGRIKRKISKRIVLYNNIID